MIFSYVSDALSLCVWRSVPNYFFQDLQKASISDCPCIKHVVGGQCISNFVRNFCFFLQKIRKIQIFDKLVISQERVNSYSY